MPRLKGLIAFAGLASAACPYLSADLERRSGSEGGSGNDATKDTEKFLSQFYLHDNQSYMTTDVGGPISDQRSLKAGERGPTLLEDFIFRQKIQRFDHERVWNALLFRFPRSFD